MRNRRLVILVVVLCALAAQSLLALSIRVLPGGIPVGEPEQLMAEGIRLGNTQLLRQAWDVYTGAVKLHPESLHPYLQLGRIYFHLSLLNAVSDQDFDDARVYAKKALELSPENAEAHQVMGLVLSGRGAHLDAMDELKMALSLNPANEFILCDMASIHLALKQPDKTIEMLEGKSLKNGWSYFVLGLAWLQKQEKGRALINFKKAERSGFSGYWLEMALNGLKRDLNIPIPLMPQKK